MGKWPEHQGLKPFERGHGILSNCSKLQYLLSWRTGALAESSLAFGAECAEWCVLLCVGQEEEARDDGLAACSLPSTVKHSYRLGGPFSSLTYNITPQALRSRWVLPTSHSPVACWWCHTTCLLTTYKVPKVNFAFWYLAVQECGKVG